MRLPDALPALLLVLISGAVAPCAASWTGTAASGQEGAPPVLEAPDSLPADTTPHPGDALRVYLLTAGPGDAIWEKFGHNALRIVDEDQGTDLAWNWGIFDFSGEDFMPRLVRGTMLYWMAPVETEATLRSYQASDRPVWLQELNLTAEQKWSLQRFVHTNFLPENRYYRYDYYRDNCSTRVRDALDRVLGGRIRAATGDEPTGTTFRWHTRRLLQSSHLAYTGIQLVLGNLAEDPISEWQEMFLPMRLREHLESVTVVGEDGAEEPLVLGEVQLVESARAPVPGRVPSRLPWYLALGLAWGAVVVILAGRAAVGGWPSRLGFVVAAGLWTLLAGVGGALIAGAWAFTDHVFWGWNENLLQANPLLLAVTPGLLAVLVWGRAPRWLSGLAVLVAGGAVLGFVIQPLSGFDQVNGEILALTLPLDLAVAWGLLVLAGPPRAGEASGAVGRSGEAGRIA